MITSTHWVRRVEMPSTDPNFMYFFNSVKSTFTRGFFSWPTSFPTNPNNGNVTKINAASIPAIIVRKSLAPKTNTTASGIRTLSV
ncbi:Uncharacterised protein [Candidatus Gugararchaeum adminiculabundum]|nr:Uncharacterised protein [Candidatus Gugararchaeum adminiculabundum]